MSREDIELRYSICITVFNESRNLRKSLGSILSQVDNSFQILIVDSESTDGTSEILAEMALKYSSIKVIETKCTRGRGRQIAFENSTGQFIIANMDMDDEFNQALRPLLDLYHLACEGDLLWVRSLPEMQDSGSLVRQVRPNEWGGGIIIAPRALIDGLGGWKDLQRFEDLELAGRAARSGRYRWCYYRIIKQRGRRDERVSLWGTILDRFANLLVRSETSHNGNEITTFKQKIALPIAYLAFFPYLRIFRPYRLFNPRHVRYQVFLKAKL